MNTLSGYSKSTLTDKYVLTASGGHRPLADSEFIVGTQTAATGSWTGVSIDSELYDGKQITYWLPYNGSGNATLNLTLAGGSTTGAVNCYYGGTSRLTTHYGAGNIIRLVYRKNVNIGGTTYTGWWADANYTDGDTYTSAWCGTAAATAAKTATCSNYTLRNNSYIHVLIRHTNTAASALTLNINSTGAKPIYINGVASSTTNYSLYAGTYIVFFDGNNYYFNTDRSLPGKIKDSSILWGTDSITGTISPIDNAASYLHSGNKLLFAKPGGITIEYSTDGGTTWIDYEVTNANKIELVSGLYNRKYLIGKGLSTKALATDLLRITLHASNMRVYTSIRSLLIDVATNGSNNCKVKVETATKGSPESFSVIGEYSVRGDSGWNRAPLNGITFGGSKSLTSHTEIIRLTFTTTGTTKETGGHLQVLSLLLLGATNWTTPSNMAKTGHLYSWDSGLNAIFPAQITATLFNGPLNGNASSATKLATKRKLWGLEFDGSANVNGNITINSGNTDNYITFTSDVSGADGTNSWRLGYLGTGSADNNLFVLQSTKNTSNTWTSALTITNETLQSTFGGTVVAPTFQGNLDGTYVNALTDYAIATTVGSISETDSLNTALGKLEFKTDFIYNDLFGTDNDEYINKWSEIVDFIDSVKESTDILDEFVTTKTDLIITGQKNFNTNTNSAPLVLSRNGLNTKECVSIGVDDNTVVFNHIQDEKTANYTFKGTWLDTDNSDGSKAGNHAVYFNLGNSYASIKLDTYTVYHTGNLTKLSQLTNDCNFVTGGPYLPLAGGTMSGNIAVFTGAPNRGLKFGASYLNSLSDQLIWQSSEAIRFGSSDWDWNSWAGLKYNHSTKTIYLGLADSTIFKANSAQSGGTLKFPGVYQIVADSNSSTVGIPLVLKNSNWYRGMSTAIDFYNGSRYTVPNARIETKINGDGRAGGTLIFYTLTAHATTNPNPNGLTERMRIGDDGIIIIAKQIERSSGGSWIKARDNAVVKQICTTSSSYQPVVSMKTVSGSWSIGTLGNSEKLIVSYDTDENYNANTNSNTAIYFPTSGGTLALTSQIPSLTNYYTKTESDNRFYGATINRTANTVLAAPNGSAGVASFRKLVMADMPDEVFKHLGTENKASVWSWGTISGTSGWNSTASDRGYRGQYGTNLDISGYSTWYHRFAMCTDGRIEYWHGINTKTLTKLGTIAWTSDIPTIPNLSLGTTTGSGNAITSISVSGHTITLNKGTTFLTSQSLADCLRSTAWINNPGQDADAMAANTMGFTYSNNAPHTGSIIYFAGTSGGSYGILLNASYYGKSISFRTRNGDNSTWNSWDRLARAEEIPTKTSQLTNDSDFITSRGYIGTTSVQASSGNLALTGINNITTPLYGFTITTPSGNIQIGPQNNTGCHIYTNKDLFYFNKPIHYWDGSSAYVYINEDTYTKYTPILNSSSTHATKSSVIYAPTTSGSGGDLLVSDGLGSAPVWTNPGNITVGGASKADKLTVARTIALSGAVTGSASFDGSANITIATTMGSHTHSTYVQKAGDTMTGSLTLDGGANLYMTTTTSKLQIFAHSDSNYILSGNKGWNGNTPLYITGYNATQGSNLYLNFANIYCRSNGASYVNLDSGNWSTYIDVSKYLPLTGGTLYNSSNMNPLSINSDSGESGIKFLIAYANKGWFGYNASYGVGIYNYTRGKYLNYKDDGTLLFEGNEVLHSGNWSNYITLPTTPSGGYIGTTPVQSIQQTQNLTGIGGITANSTIQTTGSLRGLYVYVDAIYGNTSKDMLISATDSIDLSAGKYALIYISNAMRAIYTTRTTPASLGLSNAPWGALYATSGTFTNNISANGGSFYTNTTGAYHTSDIRKKTNITKARNLDIADLLVEFDWKESGKHSWGYIAQDLLEVLPEAVDYNEDIDVYSVNYNVAHSAAIASLTARIKELEEKLKKYGIL